MRPTTYVAEHVVDFILIRPFRALRLHSSTPPSGGRWRLQLGVLGDGDPLDVVEIGSAKLTSGCVALVFLFFQ